MHIKNKRDHMLPFCVWLPSGTKFRIALEPGEEIALSPAIQSGLSENEHFNRLVTTGDLEVTAHAENGHRDRDVS